jgi:hypothetical protein
MYPLSRISRNKVVEGVDDQTETVVIAGAGFDA